LADKKLNILIGAKNHASKGLNSVKKSIKLIGAVAKGSGSDLAKLGLTAQKIASKNIRGFRKAAVVIRKYRIELKKAWKEAAKLRKKAGELAKTGAKNIAIGVAIASPLILAAKAAADYEQGLVNVQAVTRANAKDMVQLDSLAIKMGRDTAWSAKAATEGQLELAKAGLTVKEILGGALKSSLNLASSSVMNLAEASEMTAFGLKVFAHSGVDATKVVNYFSAVENKSAADTRNLKNALVAASPAITSLKVGFEDANAVLAMFADKQLKGSLAGTALKTTLLRLQPIAKPATMAMKELGIITKDGSNAFFTSAGKMKNMADIAEILKTRMSHLTEKQRIHYMTTMFGQEGLAGAVNLYEAGAKSINEYKEKLSKVDAEEVANKKLNSVSGQMTILKGSVETAAITLGKNFLPEIKSMTEMLVSGVNKLTNFMSKNKKLTMAFIIGTAALSGFVIMMGAAQMAIGGMMAIKSVIVLMKGFKIATFASKAVTVGYSAAIKFLTFHKTLFTGATKLSTWTLGLSKVALWASKAATYAYSLAQKAATFATGGFSAATGFLKGSLFVSKIALVGSKIATFAYTAAQWAMNTAITTGILPLAIIAAGAVAWFKVIKSGADVTNEFGQDLRVLTSGLEGLAAVWGKVKGFMGYLITGEISKDAIEAVKKVDDLGKKKKIGRYNPEFAKQQVKSGKQPVETQGIASKLGVSIPTALTQNIKVPKMGTIPKIPQMPTIPMQKESKIEINYNPKIEISGSATEKDKESFKKQLKEHSNDILKMVKQGLKREAQLAY